MAFDLETVRTALVNVLIANTSTIAASLTAAEVKMVRRGTPISKPTGVGQYPALWVSHRAKDQTWANLGPTAQREIRPAFRIWGALSATPESNAAGFGGHELAEMESAKMADNVEGVLRANVTLSSTVGWALPTHTEYNATMPGFGNEAQVCAFYIDVDCFTIDT